MEKWNLDFQYVHYVNDLVSAFSKHQLFLICDTCSKDSIKSLWFSLLYNFFPECSIYHFICIIQFSEKDKQQAAAVEAMKAAQESRMAAGSLKAARKKRK